MYLQRYTEGNRMHYVQDKSFISLQTDIKWEMSHLSDKLYSIEVNQIVHESYHL